jgi:hypothetical protein
MFDAVGAFKKQFTAVEGGYLVYPSRKVGGKFISAEEYDHLVSEWERVAGRAGQWKMGGVIVAGIVTWTVISGALSLPDWSQTLMIAAVVVMVSAWLIWASTAPRRLVKDRVPITPPRSAGEARREARSALNWPFVLFALLLSGAAFLGTIIATERDFSTWVWLTGSGLMFVLYMWIGLRKLTDGRG